MATSIEEALVEAIAEIKTKEWVIDATYFPQSSANEDKPGDYVAKLLNVFHYTDDDLSGTTFSTKIVYINTVDFTYKWHYGGAHVESPNIIKNFLKVKLPDIKSSMGLDFLEVVSVNEESESAILLAIKGTAGVNADTYIVKAWRTGPTTYSYKVIEKTTIT